jgi:hypothetical protein
MKSLVGRRLTLTFGTHVAQVAVQLDLVPAA